MITIEQMKDIGIINEKSNKYLDKFKIFSYHQWVAIETFHFKNKKKNNNKGTSWVNKTLFLFSSALFGNFMWMLVCVCV